ncbi:MAG: response regulator [Bacteroidia bacterium]
MKKVLIVEDDMILCMLNKKIVLSLGHQVTGVARNAAEAIDAVKVCDPDFILLDIRLKGNKDGINAMEEISKISKARAIYATGSSEEETIQRAQKTNMIAFLVKPISFEMLKEILEK